MPTNRCPTREQLREYVFGTLAEELAESIATHLATCPSCETVLEQLEQLPDEVLADLRRQPAGPIRGGAPVPEARSSIIASSGFLADAAALPAAVPDARGSGREYLGSYELLEEIGRGGMGIVYKARHTKLDRVVALKVLPAERVRDPEFVARFQREMQAVGRLDHQNIVRATDGGEAAGKHFLVMEYIPGVNLEELVRQRGPLAVADACELIRQAALGLQCAHEHGMVHRDVKPSNLMLTPDGQVKIFDLGLAKLRTTPSSGPEMTGTGQKMGTAGYMAPEQLADCRAVDIRADIYSLGCTLFKLLTGHAPFDSPQYPVPYGKEKGAPARCHSADQGVSRGRSHGPGRGPGSHAGQESGRPLWHSGSSRGCIEPVHGGFRSVRRGKRQGPPDA